MALFDIFRKDDRSQEMEALSTKISELEAVVEKQVGVTNASLAGIVNGNFIELTAKGLENPYNSNYVIYRGINLLAQGIAQLPLRIYKGDTLMDVDFAFPTFDLQSPNNEMSLYELLYTTCIYYFYRGEYMNYINLDDVRMTLEPINPKLMQLLTQTASQETPPDWKWNNKKVIPNDQLIYTKFLNPDGVRGLGPVDVIKAELLNDAGAIEFNTKYFQNFGKIGGTLRDEMGNINTEEMRKLVNEFNAAHGGSNQAHKVLGLPGGIKYDGAAQTMKEMEFLASRKDIRDRILIILGIHKALVGVTDKVDRALADAASRQVWMYTLKPNAIRIQEKFNQHLFKRYFPGYKCKFDFSAVEELRANKSDVLGQATQYRDLGYTMNEINDLFDLGMEEVTESVGDMRFVPNNLIPADDIMLEPIDNSSNTPKAVDIEAILDKMVDIVGDDTTTMDKASRQYVNRYTKLRRGIDRAMAGKIRKYFSNQLGKVLAVIKEEKSIDKIDTTILTAAVRNLLNQEKQVLITLVKPVYEDGSQKASQLAVDTLGLGVKARVNQEIVGTMINNLTGVNNTTYKIISKQISEAVAAGESVDMMAKRIQQVYKFSSSRARTISRTESAGIVNKSTDAEYKANGVKKKQWLSARDGKVREAHVNNNSAGIVDYDHVYSNGQKFPNDGIGGGANNINCRCALAPVIV